MPLNWIDFLRMFLFGDFNTWVFGFLFGAITVWLIAIALRKTSKWMLIIRLLVVVLIFVVMVFGMVQTHYAWERFQEWSDTTLGPPLQLQPAGEVLCPGGICPGDPNPFNK